MEKSTAYSDIGYGWEPEEEPTAPRPSASIEMEETEPTPDQIYLADALSKDAPKGRITEVVLAKWNMRYGTGAVTSALRLARGFSTDIHSAYGFVDNLLKKGSRRG